MTYSEERLHNWVVYYQMYLDLFGINKLKKHYIQLKLVEDEWRRSNYYVSYSMSIMGIEIVLRQYQQL